MVGKVIQARNAPRKRKDRTDSGGNMIGILSEVPLSGGLQVADAPFARLERRGYLF
jgi:hypothetical protein